MRTSLTARLWSVIEGESPDAINTQIALTLLDNISRLGRTSLASLAKLCGVSKPTMSRFARVVGFDDFYEFRLALEQAEPYGESRWQLETSASGQDALDAFADEAAGRLGFLHERTIQDQVRQLAHDMHAYHRVLLMGSMQSGDAASLLHYHVYGRTSQVRALTGYEEQATALHSLQPDTLLVLFSVSGAFLTSFFRRGEHLEKPSGCKVWLLCCDSAAEVPPEIDECVNTRTGVACTGGNLSLMVLATAIAMCFHADEAA